jgi:hypothetical protein
MRRTLAVLGVVGLLAGWVAAQESTPGTQPGRVLPGSFRAYVVTNPETRPAEAGVLSEDRQNLSDVARVGRFHDFVTRYGLDPTVAVFARDIPAADQPLAKLLKALDESVKKHRNARLHAFGIFLTLKGEYFQDEAWSSLIKQIESLAQQLQLKNVPLALDKTESERTKAYQIAPENAAVVLVYVNQQVVARFAFTADKPLDDAGVQAILGQVNKLVESRR